MIDHGRLCKYLAALCALLLAWGASANAPREYPLPNPDMRLIGEIEERELRYEDTFAKVARAAGVGVPALTRLNPQVDPWMPGAGTKVRLPTAFILPEAPQDGIVVNLSERRLYYFDQAGQRLLVYPIGIGSDRGATPLGLTRTVMRIKDPSWTPPASIRAEYLERGIVLPGVVPPGPENPLGGYAIQLGWPGYFIHGTNRAIGVGGLVSAGCIRLYPDHIEMLATTVPNGTPVRVVEQPYKVAWSGDRLFLEAHPLSIAPEERDYTDAIAAILEAAGSAEIDLRRAVEVARDAAGIPQSIGGR